MQTERTSIGISLRRITLERLDEIRGDVPRSRVIERAIEAKLGIVPNKRGES
jgi:metal-responsive CopG/Arc/MetJ family transcriptional regulator